MYGHCADAWWVCRGTHQVIACSMFFLPKAGSPPRAPLASALGSCLCRKEALVPCTVISKVWDVNVDVC